MHRIVSLLLEIVILFIVIVFKLITSVLGRFCEIDGFAPRATAVVDDVVRVDFFHVVVIFFFRCKIQYTN